MPVSGPSSREHADTTRNSYCGNSKSSLLYGDHRVTKSSDSVKGILMQQKQRKLMHYSMLLMIPRQPSNAFNHCWALCREQLVSVLFFLFGYLALVNLAQSFLYPTCDIFPLLATSLIQEVINNVAFLVVSYVPLGEGVSLPGDLHKLDK